MFRVKTLRRWEDFAFRLARSEGALRGFNFFWLAGVLGGLSYVKSRYYDPVYVAPKKIAAEKELQELDAKAKQVLFYNRFKSPTRPHRSLEDIIAFLTGYFL